MRRASTRQAAVLLRRFTIGLHRNLLRPVVAGENVSVLIDIGNGVISILKLVDGRTLSERLLNPAPDRRHSQPLYSLRSFRAVNVFQV
jgi:hypothetical protein